MGTQPPSPKRGGSPPKFSAHFYCSQTAGCINLPLGMDVGLSPGDFVLGGYPVPLPKKGAKSPKFSAHVYCGQTAGWISPGDFVLDGDPTPSPKRGAAHPIFGICLLWPNGCMDQNATWYGGRPQPTRHCVRCGPSYPQKKRHTHPIQFLAHVYCGTEVDLGTGHTVLYGVPAPAKKAQQPHYFRPMSIVATVAHFSYCWALV